MEDAVSKPCVTCVRPATIGDLPWIMLVERQAFEGIDEAAVATEEMMEERIRLCNTETHNWFWLALHENRIVGYVVAQPTKINPYKLSTWEEATDNGTLKGTFDPNGENIHIVSLGEAKDAPYGVAAALGKFLVAEWKRSGKKLLMFFARMPGYRAQNELSPISPEEYWQQREADGQPRDPFLRFLCKILAGQAVALLPGGYLLDKASGGNAVLVVASDWEASEMSLQAMTAEEEKDNE